VTCGLRPSISGGQSEPSQLVSCTGGLCRTLQASHTHPANRSLALRSGIKPFSHNLYGWRVQAERSSASTAATPRLVNTPCWDGSDGTRTSRNALRIPYWSLAKLATPPGRPNPHPPRTVFHFASADVYWTLISSQLASSVGLAGVGLYVFVDGWALIPKPSSAGHGLSHIDEVSPSRSTTFDWSV
jgi:hypothetical protein